MSTLRRTPRLLNLFGLGLCVGAGLAGCSSTPARQSGAASKMKTFLSVGDKPLPVVSGEPGSTVAADVGSDSETYRPSGRDRVRPDGRISGRVFDADGRPVPEARVRLAVSGAPGGKVVNATTDRSGAFTLHGLRPGSRYTVIAETEGDQGVETGRADARTSDTDVRISLAPQDDPPARASTPVRVNRVSDREPSDESLPEAGAVSPAQEGESRPSGRVNEEDLPPAPEAEALAPTSRRSRASGSDRRPPSASIPSDAWKSRPASRNAPAPVDPEARGTGASPVEFVAPPDDGENPLPPALERVPDDSASAVPREPDRPPGSSSPVAARKPDPDLDRFLGASTSTRQAAASSPFESPSHPSGSTLPPNPPEDSAPGALVVVPETFGPVVASPTDPYAGFRPPAPEATPSGARNQTKPRPVAESESAAASSKPSRTAGGEKRRPTWAEVVATATASPEGEAPAGSSGPTAERRALAMRTSDPVRPDRAVRPSKATFGKAECEYDERLRRVIDFRLPGLDGKSVRFQDLDSDLVLLDFWGTWCPPCIRSIPHLVELQEKMGQRLTVVGVACEGDSPQASSAKVAETARQLKVNYPILLSRNDGSCPLQEALHVQAFPTMILVDREGRVLWRDQGATPATMARLDRIIASTPKGDETRRY